MNTTSPRKLDKSKWGIRYFSNKSGESIQVEKRDGTTSTVTLGSEVQTGIYLIQKSEKTTYRSYVKRSREDWRELIENQDCDCTHYITANRPCNCGGM